MAKEYITRCDAAFTVKVRDCGETHEDTRTFTIRVDGSAWEVDLGGPHAAALLDIATKGRAIPDSRSGAAESVKLERRIRNRPE